MNKSYRIVWNHARRCLMVVSEATKSHGKGGASKAAVVTSVAAAVMAIAASEAAATDWTISAPQTTSVVLDTGDTLNITDAGSVSVTRDYPIKPKDPYITLGTTTSGSDTFSIFNAGTITAGTLVGGIYLSYASSSGAIINSGSIYGGNGIYAKQAQINGNLANSGTIVGARTGITLFSSNLLGGFTNSGSIQGVAATGIGIMVRNSSTINGGFLNSGTISGNRAVYLNFGAINDGITNTGLINGAAFGISTMVAQVTGGLNNTGTIIGSANAGIALSYATISGGITNSGLIRGGSGAYSISVSGNSSLDRIVIAGANTASFGGTVSALNTPVTIAGGATYTGSANFKVSSFSNEGTFILQPSSIAGTNYTIAGNYNQTSSGTLQVNVVTTSGAGSGTVTGNYGKFAVTGTATFAKDSNVYVQMSSQTAVAVGGTLAGVVNAGTLSSNGFTITDNSALVDFGYATTSGALNLIAFQVLNPCTSPLTGSQTGPCKVAFDNPLLQVQSTGTISGGDQGVTVLGGLIGGSGTTTGIYNYGTINGNFTGIRMGGGTTFVGDITNTGLISGNSSYGIEILNSSISGSILNTVGGTITGGLQGILIGGGSTVSGGILDDGGYISSISNAGLISGGISISGDSLIAGSIYNSGSIAHATNAALSVMGSSVGGNIVNSGTISGGQFNGAINLHSSTVVGNVVNSGSVGGLSRGLNVQDSLINGDIDNGGTIAAAYVGVYLSAATVSGGFTNAGSISGQTGVFISHVSIAGGISNAGTISGGQIGLVVKSYANINGGISNSGMISGAAAGLKIGDSGYPNSTVAGGINNSGRIIATTGTGLGVSSYSYIDGGITNSGTISGSRYGLWIDASTINGSIVNTIGGMISSGTTGIKIAYSSITGSLNNAGTISAGVSRGALLIAYSTISGGITNSGSIGGNGSYGLNISSSSIAGGIANNGIISGGNTGIKFTYSSITGGITNSGSIGGISYGLYVKSSSIAGGIVNNGKIAGTGTGIFFSNVNVEGGITNSGLISGGSSNSIYMYASSVDRIVIAGANTATFVGDVYAPGTPVTIAGGATYTGSANFTVSNFSNEGKFILQPSAIAGANYTISGDYNQASSATLQVNVTSSGTDGSGTLAGNYGQLAVTGKATFGNASGIYVEMTPKTAVVAGGTLVGVVSAGTLVTDGFKISDNSAKINFIYETVSGLLDLIAITQAAPPSTITGAYTGPYEVAFDNPVVTVETTGTISGAAQGVTVLGGIIGGSGTIAGIFNHGTISGSATGIRMGGGTTLVGGITNSGLIEGGSNYGVEILNSSISGGIHNTVGGTIIGGLEGILIGGGSTVSGGITNDGGLINGISNAGIIDGGVSISGGGQLTNGFNNSGSITGGQTGISLNNGTLTGGITNSGSIGGVDYGVEILNSSISGGIHNTVGGTITGGLEGILIGGGSTVSGGISNDGGNINGISNAGVINGGISISGGGQLTNGINNTGSITGGQTGISLNNGTLAGGITNSGSIGGADYGIGLLNASISGGIQNLAGVTISGGLGGILIGGGSTVSGGISNAGVINGGIIVTNGGGKITNGINNTGTVTGGLAGILVGSGSTVSGGITSSGLISGSPDAIHVDSNASVDRILIKGNNTASFSGNVVAPNTPVTIAGGAAYTMDNTVFTVSGFTNEGTLNAPTASVSTPKIVGNLTLGSTGTFSPTVASQSDYTHITVTGNVNLGGALYVNALNVSGTIAKGATLTGIIRGNSLTGTFASYNTNSVLYTFTPVYTGTDLNLTVDQRAGASIANSTAASGNKAGAGAANTLDAIAAAGGMVNVIDAFGRMTSDGQISNAVSQTLPVMTGATQISTLAVLSGLNKIIEARGLQQRGISSGDDFYANNTAWIKPFGSWMNQGNQNGAYGYKANTGGLIIGGDTLVQKDLRLGAAVAWGNTSASSNAGGPAQSQTSNLYQFIGYGSYALTNTLEANFQANGGWNNNTSNRQIGFMGTSAQGSYSSAVWHVGAGLSNPFQFAESTQLIPSARFDYSWIRNSAYSETGASNGLGLNVAAQTYQASVASVDGKVVHKLNDHHSVSANLGVGYNFSPTQTNVAAAFQGAPTLQFTTNGVNPSATMGRAGAGYTYKVKENVDVGIRYDIDFQSQYTNQIATAKARWMF